MITLDPRLILTALAVLWAVIVVAIVSVILLHGIRVLLARRRDRADAQARPLVIRYALADDEDAADPAEVALAETLRGATGLLGERIDERLLSVLETLRGDSRARIAAMLIDRGHPARLRRRARLRRTTVRAAAVRRLGQLGLPSDEEAVRRATTDPAPIVQTVAVRALAAYPSAASVEAVLDRLRHRAEVPSLVVVTSLITQGGTDPRALAAIRQALSDPAPRVRAAAAQTLGELSSAADTARLGALLRLDPTPGVQLAAATALTRVGTAESVPALLEGTRSPWGMVRSHALGALLALPREESAEALAAVAASGDPLLTSQLRTELPGSRP